MILQIGSERKSEYFGHYLFMCLCAAFRVQDFKACIIIAGGRDQKKKIKVRTNRIVLLRNRLCLRETGLSVHPLLRITSTVPFYFPQRYIHLGIDQVSPWRCWILSDSMSIDDLDFDVLGQLMLLPPSAWPLSQHFSLPGRIVILHVEAISEEHS